MEVNSNNLFSYIENTNVNVYNKIGPRIHEGYIGLSFVTHGKSRIQEYHHVFSHAICRALHQASDFSYSELRYLNLDLYNERDYEMLIRMIRLKYTTREDRLDLISELRRKLQEVFSSNVKLIAITRFLRRRSIKEMFVNSNNGYNSSIYGKDVVVDENMCLSKEPNTNLENLVPEFMLLGNTDSFPDMLYPFDYSQTKLVINNRKFFKSKLPDKYILEHITKIKNAGCTNVEFLEPEVIRERYLEILPSESNNVSISTLDSDIEAIKAELHQAFAPEGQTFELSSSGTSHFTYPATGEDIVHRYISGDYVSAGTATYSFTIPGIDSNNVSEITIAPAEEFVPDESEPPSIDF